MTDANEPGSGCGCLSMVALHWCCFSLHVLALLFTFGIGWLLTVPLHLLLWYGLKDWDKTKTVGADD